LGRSVGSIRQEVNGIAERWHRSAQVLGDKDRLHGEHLASLAKVHSSDVFYGCDEPLEAAVFSVLSEIQKKLERMRERVAGDPDVDP
jgi:hypothetical protein